MVLRAGGIVGVWSYEPGKPLAIDVEALGADVADLEAGVRAAAGRIGSFLGGKPVITLR